MSDLAPVIEGIDLGNGQVNVPEATILAQMAGAIRRGHPQLRVQPPTYDRVALLGGGPSLNTTLDELDAVLRDGAKLVTTNGAYHWALERHYLPKTQVVLDARPSTARFVEPAIPGCNYLVASQCHPAVWDALEGRDRVFIFHSVTKGEGAASDLLDAYYQQAWQPVNGGVTVVTRALMALRLMGYLRFDLFGVDSCWLDGEHHAYPQPENVRDRRYQVRVTPPDRPDLATTFECAPWHLKQFEDFLQMIRVSGHQWGLTVHGEGLLAHAMRVQARDDDIVITEET